MLFCNVYVIHIYVNLFDLFKQIRIMFKYRKRPRFCVVVTNKRVSLSKDGKE